MKHLFLLMLSPVFLGFSVASAADKEAVADAVTAVVEAEATSPEAVPNPDGVIDPVVTPESTSAAEVSVADVQLPFDLKAAADLAIDTFGGEVVKAEETPDEAGLLLFTIRIVNEGRVKDVVIDAANGDIIKPLEEPLTAVTESAAESESDRVADEAPVSEKAPLSEEAAQ
ncbi:hypothetical protein XMG59_002324 [Marinobacterium sp. xm-g-59]|uniref:PepSY domain-containing protein n=1 Tax=Marinobacterium sp. xm-g-59 TaxID=2497748 RepID=UPI001569C7CE|nr:PepSY domain-containing protein [Marinobacterium sp. xm-g-59]NRP96205.1 hypothetical protein [Marinobacterium sp. xm-g-59]